MGKEQLAFTQEFYKQKVNRAQVRDDLVSYLAEYRFEVPEFRYSLKYKEGELVDPNTLEPMSQKTKKAIEYKGHHKQNTQREEAEYEGFKKIESDLSENPFGTIVWFSPPGPKEDSYGDYGFAYIGSRRKDQVEMTAFRLESSDFLTDFNQTKELFEIDGGGFQTAEEFLRSPWVVSIDKEKAEKAIKQVFKTPNQDKNLVFEKAISSMGIIIEDFLEIIENGTEEEKQKALYAIENYALARKRVLEQGEDNVIFLKKDENRLSWIIPSYSFKPPVISGSCGGSSLKTANFFNTLINTSLTLDSSREGFICPNCGHHANGPVGNQCPNCKITKEEYALETGVLVCE